MHPGQTKASLPDVRRVESAAIIDHLEAEPAKVVDKANHDPTRVRVALDIVQRFLSDSEDDQLVLRGQPQRVAFHLQSHTDPTSPGQVSEQPIQRRHQPQIVQHRGAQGSAETPDTVDGPL